jgi:hypothetical protein
LTEVVTVISSDEVTSEFQKISPKNVELDASVRRRVRKDLVDVIGRIDAALNVELLE